VRGLLIVNPQATTTTGNTADLAIRSLAGLVDLDVEHTRYRGHARELAAAARGELVIVLGGDGAVNEAVNGLMSQQPEPDSAGPEGAGPEGAARTPPLLAVIPGGGGNVFAQALGLPVDTAAAIGKIRAVLQAGRHRTIGLGLAGDRYFTFSAGLGLDAEAVGEVERLRASGHRESPTLFAWAIMRRFMRTDRRTPVLTLERDGQPATPDLFMTAITNRSPWTYVRGRAVLPVPNPDFNSGLDVLALRKLRATTILSAVGQMLLIRRRSPRGRNVLTVTGLESLTVRSERPVAFQVDGDYLGQTEAVKFQFVPHALRVVA
jgi:diacylglycerol kinase family enzyme